MKYLAIEGSLYKMKSRDFIAFELMFDPTDETVHEDAIEWALDHSVYVGDVTVLNY